MHDDSLSMDELVAAAERLSELGAQIEPRGFGACTDDNERLLWNLVVLGDSAKRLSPELIQRYAEVPWREMARTRDRVAHHYENTDWVVVEAIVKDDLPDLLPRLREIRERLRRESCR